MNLANHGTGRRRVNIKREMKISPSEITVGKALSGLRSRPVSDIKAVEAIILQRAKSII